jgi:hypothetical protein
MLLAVDKRVTLNEVNELWHYLTLNSVESFEAMKMHITNLPINYMVSRRFNQSIILIF